MTQALYNRLIESIPYAKTLGIEAELDGEGLLLVLPFLKSNIGNPTLPALHGGAIGGFMANVRVRAWQESPDKPIAALSGHFLLPKQK